MLAAQAVPARQLQQRLGATGPPGVGLLVGEGNLSGRVTQTIGQQRGLVLRVPGFFFPAAHGGALAIDVAAARQLAGIAQALCQVVDVARIGWVGAQRVFQQRRVLAVGLGIAAACPIVRDLHDSPGQRRGLGGNVGVQPLMHHAPPPPGQPRRHQGCPGVDQLLIVALQLIGVGRQWRAPPVGGEGQGFIGVDEEQVVDRAQFAQRQVQRLVAVVFEMAPRPIVQAAGQAVQVLPHQVGGAVGRPGVHDDPLVDEAPQRREAAPDDRRLVLDDHVQADAGRAGVHGIGG